MGVLHHGGHLRLPYGWMVGGRRPSRERQVAVQQGALSRRLLAGGGGCNTARLEGRRTLYLAEGARYKLKPSILTNTGLRQCGPFSKSMRDDGDLYVMKPGIQAF